MFIDEEEIIIQQLRENNYPIYVYGAGSAAEDLTKFLARQGFSITAYCVDDAYYNEGAKFFSVPIIPIENLRDKMEKYHLFLGVGKSDIVRKIAEQNVFCHDIYFIFDPNKIWQSNREFCDTYKQRFAYLNNNLSDSLSCETLWSWLEAKIAGKVKAHLPHCLNGTYFNSLVDVRGGGHLLIVVRMMETV